MFGLFGKKPEVCNVLGDSITLRLTAEQTEGKYSVAEFATPGGVGQTLIPMTGTKIMWF